MKKIVIVCLMILLFQKWGAISDYLNPPPDYSAAHGGQVVLYATAWCGYCIKTRALLNGKNVSFHEYDIETSREGADQFRRLGGQGVPVLLISGEVIHGYNPARILELTGKL